MIGLVVILLIINHSAGVSYNQPKFSLCALWDSNATTFADGDTIGQQPSGIFINIQNNIYVTDREHGRILIWDNETSTPTKIISEDLIKPWSLFVTTQDDIFVDNGNFNNRIDKWTVNTTTHKFVMNVNGSCTGLFVDINNNLYCSLVNHHRVVRFTLDNHLALPMIVAGTGCPGPIANMLDHPHGIFVDIGFNLYVADSYNNRIQQLMPNQMNAITVVGFGAAVYFILNRPTCIIVGVDGDLFIVDSHNHRIVRSTIHGVQCLVGCSGKSGAMSSQLHNPQTMAFDSNGNIFVTDVNNHRIQKFILTINSCETTTSTKTTTSTTTITATTTKMTTKFTTTLSCYFGKDYVNLVEGGRRHISQLKVGDRVWTLSHDGEHIIEDEIMFIGHAVPNTPTYFYTFTTIEGHTISLTDADYIVVATNDKINMEIIHASKVTLNHKLIMAGRRISLEK
ncbi:hypothetical protein I4U23_016779 [Adineta vaga]|nr:hypothetical protein I4U23_016779 [Adineta vaga]